MKTSPSKVSTKVKVPAYDKDGNYLGEFERSSVGRSESPFDPLPTSLFPPQYVKKNVQSKSSEGKSSTGTLLEKVLNGVKGAGNQESSKSSKKKSALNTDTSIVDYLKNSGKSSDFSSRKSLAETFDLGDEEYKGSAKQNIRLLRALKDSKPVTTDDEVDEDHILKQNQQDVDDGDIQDGTWDNYLEYVKNQDGGAIPFSVYKRKVEKGLV